MEKCIEQTMYIFGLRYENVILSIMPDVREFYSSLKSEFISMHTGHDTCASEMVRGELLRGACT
jgi:hypothetical protein